MEEQELTADDIRAYWKHWLDHATDEEVMKWHKVIVTHQALDPNNIDPSIWPKGWNVPTDIRGTRRPS